MPLANLKGQRSKLGKKIVDNIEKAKGFLSIPASPECVEETAESIDAQIEICKDLSSRYEALSSKIVESMAEKTEAELEAEGESALDLVLDLSEIISLLSSRLKAINRKIPNASMNDTANNSALEERIHSLIDLETSKQESQVKSQSNIKLPKLDFEAFSGNILKWSEFWDTFSASVHLNDSLQQVQKLAYLRAKLRGEAKSVIAGLDTTNENYDVALGLLKERYGDEQTIISAHYSKLMDLPQVPNQTERLRFLWDSLEQHLCCLSSLGEDVNHRHFISMIMHKLPEPVIVKLEEMKDRGEAWSVQLLRSKLQSHLVARETAGRQTIGALTRSAYGRNCTNYPASTVFKNRNSDTPHRSEVTNRDTKSRFSTAETLYTSDKDKTQEKKQPYCIYCKGKHWSDECFRFSTVSARKKQLQSRCLNCLGKDHAVRNCKSSRPCFHCKKTKDHHSSLCLKKFPKDGEPVHIATEREEEEEGSNPDESLLASGESDLLQTAFVKARTNGSKRLLNLRLLFDSGSHRSYISQVAAEKLGLKPKGSEIISVNTFGATRSKDVYTSIADVSLKLQDDSTTTIVANIVPRISASVKRQHVNLSKYKDKLKGLKLADTFPENSQAAEIDILIGSDYYMDLMTFEKIAIGENLYLLGSKFGWILTGRLCNSSKTKKDYSMLILNYNYQSCPQLSESQPKDLSRLVEPNTEDFWNLETIGIKDSAQDISDEQAIESFNQNVKYDNKRYLVKWPWREELPNLPSNFQLSLGRLKSLTRRLSSNPAFLKQYSQVIEDQLTKGVIEKVFNKESSSPLVHYIPHQAVVTPQKTTTKIRVVYDASAKTRKEAKSLNECLLRGPVILENLCGLLMRFRLHKYAVIADVEKAFLQVGLQEEARDVVRFLWLKDPSKCSVEDNIQVYRFTRVPFGVISSPFLLGATISYHLKQAGTPIAGQIMNHMYVDNMITGVPSPKEAKELYSEGKSLFESASMNLREWISNCQDFMESIPEKDRCKDISPKVLGMVWKVDEDSISMPKVTWSTQDKRVTKRQVFKTIARFFDPLGLFSPSLIQGKLFLQELWKEGLKWDDCLTEQQKAKWNEILKNIVCLPDLKVSRSISSHHSNDQSIYSLICFCDASTKAYASVIYLRWTDQRNSGATLLFAKSRLAPIKRQTVPRLELLAVLIGVRSLNFVESQIKLCISHKVIFSDSQCVLHWIKSPKLQGVFVNNRLKEIKSYKDVEFKFVRSEDNPADLPTRGMSVNELEISEIWWYGPKWLISDVSEWPNQEKFKDTGSKASPIGSSTLFEVSFATVEKSTEPTAPFEIDELKFSKLNKLLRVTAWCQRFLENVKGSWSKKPKFLTASEVDKAKVMWEKFVQKKHYSKVIKAISERKRDDLIEKFDLHLDKDDLLRCGGRRRHAELSDDAKFPKLLPKDDPFTVLIIRDIHERLIHSGSSHTLADLRHKYWLPQGRRQVQKVISKCTICRKLEGGPYKVPPMPSIPKCRVARTNPFSYTGVDYFGPLYVKTKGCREKVWVSIFTCMTVRAIHLGLASDLSAAEFLLCFRRFASRRGTPRQVFSDNGTNFQAASKVIQIEWNHIPQDKDIQSYFSISGIDWKFIPQFSPWMGGFYERLVGVTKRSLRKAIGRLCVNPIQLQTVLCEVEAVVNSRPLLYVDSDISSMNPITPRHFLSLNPQVGLPSFSTVDEDDLNDEDFKVRFDSHDALLESWKKGQIHLDVFWKEWKENYLTSLRERSQRLLMQPHRLSHRFPKDGDVVIVKDNDFPRGSWKVARVVSLVPSSDGEFRSAKIALPTKKITIRPLALLYPLECENDYHTFDDDSSAKNGATSESDIRDNDFNLATISLSDADLAVMTVTIPQLISVKCSPCSPLLIPSGSSLPSHQILGYQESDSSHSPIQENSSNSGGSRIQSIPQDGQSSRVKSISQDVRGSKVQAISKDGRSSKVQSISQDGLTSAVGQYSSTNKPSSGFRMRYGGERQAARCAREMLHKEVGKES